MCCAAGDWTQVKTVLNIFVRSLCPEARAEAESVFWEFLSKTPGSQEWGAQSGQGSSKNDEQIFFQAKQN